MSGWIAVAHCGVCDAIEDIEPHPCEGGCKRTVCGECLGHWRYCLDCWEGLIEEMQDWIDERKRQIGRTD